MILFSVFHICKWTPLWSETAACFLFQMSRQLTACSSVWQSCPPRRSWCVTAPAIPAATLTTPQHTAHSSTSRSWPPSEPILVALGRLAWPPRCHVHQLAACQGALNGEGHSKGQAIFYHWHMSKTETAEKRPLDQKCSAQTWLS